MDSTERGTGQPGARRARALDELRAKIDQVDGELATVLIERFRLAEEIGEHKGSTDTLAVDPRREAEVVRRATRAARDAGLPEEAVRSVFWAVIDCCRDAVVSEHRRTSTLRAGGC